MSIPELPTRYTIEYFNGIIYREDRGGGSYVDKQTLNRQVRLPGTERLQYHRSHFQTVKEVLTREVTVVPHNVVEPMPFWLADIQDDPHAAPYFMEPAPQNGVAAAPVAAAPVAAAPVAAAPVAAAPVAAAPVAVAPVAAARAVSPTPVPATPVTAALVPAPVPLAHVPSLAAADDLPAAPPPLVTVKPSLQAAATSSVANAAPGQSRVAPLHAIKAASATGATSGSTSVTNVRARPQRSIASYFPSLLATIPSPGRSIRNPIIICDNSPPDVQSITSTRCDGDDGSITFSSGSIQWILDFGAGAADLSIVHRPFGREGAAKMQVHRSVATRPTSKDQAEGIIVFRAGTVRWLIRGGDGPQDVIAIHQPIAPYATQVLLDFCASLKRKRDQGDVFTDGLPVEFNNAPGYIASASTGAASRHTKKQRLNTAPRGPAMSEKARGKLPAA